MYQVGPEYSEIIWITIVLGEVLGICVNLNDWW